VSSIEIGILGYGEIGSSLGKVIEEAPIEARVEVQDPRLGRYFPEDFNPDVLHVAVRVPDHRKFVEIVSEVVERTDPGLVIIESTLPVGTTRKISGLVSVPVVHSPCRGVHPNLVEGLRTFVKFVGGVAQSAVDRAIEYYASLGIRAEPFSNPEATELFKLLSTTYYMTNVVFCKEAHRLCEHFGVPFEEVYVRGNETYNEGYTKLGRDKVREDRGSVIRPVLHPIPGPMGGHCLRPNLEIINSQVSSSNFPLFRLLQDLDDNYAGGGKGD